MLSDGGASGATLSLTTSGAGTQTLSSANTYSGATIVSGGTLKIALEWAHSLSGTVTWVSVVTNQVAGNGRILFTNTPSRGSDFYRTVFINTP